MRFCEVIVPLILISFFLAPHPGAEGAPGDEDSAEVGWLVLLKKSLWQLLFSPKPFEVGPLGTAEDEEDIIDCPTSLVPLTTLTNASGLRDDRFQQKSLVHAFSGTLVEGKIYIYINK